MTSRYPANHGISEAVKGPRAVQNITTHIATAGITTANATLRARSIKSNENSTQSLGVSREMPNFWV